MQTTLSLTVATFGYGGVTSYTAIMAIERHIKPESIYLTVFAGTVVFYRVFFSPLGDRIGLKAVLYPSLALIPIAFAAFILGNTDPERRARTFGSIVWAFDTGIGTGSLVIGVLGEHLGLSFAFKVAAALSCFSIPIFAWASRHLASRGTSLAADLEHARTD
jgi:predicted MFS family arabinose efflux permease